MAQKTDICSGPCTYGEITLFFAHHSERRLRRDYVYCHICRPDSNQTTALPEVGEEQIDSAEFDKLFDLGWREVDPV